MTADAAPPGPTGWPRGGLLPALRARRLELVLFAGSFAALALVAGPRVLHQSHAPHFIYQADAWLHGQLHLRVGPPDDNDWARVGDRWEVSFPPGPALLMLPGVALWGFQLDDVTFTLFFAALNVLLLFLLLEQLRLAGEHRRSREDDAALAMLFGFGTVAFSCSIRGEVWFTAEVLGVTASLLYLMAAHRARRPLLAGLAFGLAAVTRAPLVFSAVFFLAEVVAGDDRLGARWRDPAVWRDRARWRRLGLFALGAAPLLAATAWANAARFGSPFDFGHAHFWNNRVNADIQRYGLFSLHYLEAQLHAAFTRLPLIQDGRLAWDPQGLSLLVTTPLFLWLLWPRERPRLHLALWLTAAAAALPGFLYQNTGYVQFGYRFSLDWTPHLFLLLALGGRPMGRAFWAAGLAGVAVNTWGALTFTGGVN